MKQSSLDLNLSAKKTRKQELLAQMDLVVPWAALVGTSVVLNKDGSFQRTLCVVLFALANGMFLIDHS